MFLILVLLYLLYSITPPIATKADVDSDHIHMAHIVSCFSRQCISDKIKSLNLKQLRAKIEQMNSHATLGGGIVIQVRRAILNAIINFVMF